MTDPQLRVILNAILGDQKTVMKGAYRAALEMWLAQAEAKSAIREAA